MGMEECQSRTTRKEAKTELAYLIDHKPHKLFPHCLVRDSVQSMLSHQVNNLSRIRGSHLLPQGLNRVGRFILEHLLLSLSTLKSRLLELFDSAGDLGTRD